MNQRLYFGLGGMLGLAACTSISADKPEPSEDHGTVIGNPGDMDMSAGAGDGAVARTATVRGGVLTQTSCESESNVSTLDSPLDLLDATVPLAFDRVCGLTLSFDSPLVLTGEGTAGGTFAANIDIDEISLQSASGIETDEQDFVVELGEPGWLVAEQLGLITGEDVTIDSTHPVHPLLVVSLTQRSQLFADDGDGTISDTERVSGSEAQTPTTSLTSRFIAVGDEFRRTTSVDGGDTWILNQTEPGEEPLYALGHGQTDQGDLYVAVGGDTRGVVMTSLAGDQWTESEIADAPLCGIAHGDGSGFVTVGYDGTRMQSDDGVLWTDHSSGSDAIYKSVAYGDGKYIAVGFDGTRLKSANGKDWFEADLTGLRTDDLHEVVFGGGLFAAVGASGLISTTEDGVTWTDHSTITDVSLTGVAFGDDRFVAVGSGQIFWTEDWNTGAGTVEDLLAPDGVDKVTFGDGTFIAVGQRVIYRSADGEVWTSAAVDASPKFRGVGFGATP